MKNTNLKASFLHAFKGLADAFERERNLRVHLSFAIEVAAFAYVYKITKIEALILVGIIAFVIFAELMNSAVEKAVDTATDKFRFDAMHAKDYAAGAVLTSAIGAIIIGIIIFGDIERLSLTLCTVFSSLKLIILFSGIILLDCAIIMYPLIKKQIMRGKNK